MGDTPICSISAAGIYKPTLDDCLNYYVSGIQSIYGADTYLGSDSQDGQLIGLFASTLDDCNALAVLCYNSFSPTTAQGVGLSSNIKLNGMERLVPSYSTCPVIIGGGYETAIDNGVVADEAGNLWSLPASVVISLRWRGLTSSIGNSTITRMPRTL